MEKLIKMKKKSGKTNKNKKNLEIIYKKINIYRNFR